MGLPYFNLTFVPIAAPLVFFSAFGPFLSWKRADLPGVLDRLKFAFAAGVVAALLAAYLTNGGPVLAAAWDRNCRLAAGGEPQRVV